MTTVAGSGEEGYEDGDATAASFSFPGGIALFYDSSGGERQRLNDCDPNSVHLIIVI